MTLSILIVNWNTRELLRACLQSLRRYPLSEPMEVWVLDNASPDGSAEMVRTEFPEVHLVASERNLGYAAGNNLLLQQAQGEYLLLLNPDTEVTEGALDTAVRYLREHPDVAALGAKLVYPDGRVQRSVRGFPEPEAVMWEYLGLARLFPHSRRFGAYRMTWFTYDQIAEVDQPMGTFLMLSRRAVQAVGLMDERFPIFFNEVDWCYRAKQQGLRMVFHPGVVIIHHGGASTRQVRPQMIWESHRSLQKFYEKHYRHRLPKPVYWLIRASIFLNAWLRTLGRGREGWQGERKA
ncbi:MAG: glycosyltransferase family 2 protein [Armatimonadota bacterium]|nr:glycosyltransferase family 2 protein [Armatimonadota bacterium]MDW8290097.1 glycosyltransferase family 2 protein [Armatimonadota bacterium]